MSTNKHNQLTTFLWLVRREYWQNRGLFLWAPVAIGIAFFAMFLFVEFVAKDVTSVEHRTWMQENFGGEEAKHMIARSQQIIVADMSRFILQAMMVISSLFSSLYLFGALNTERRDRSIFFWKSMPVSDTQEVLSKLVFPLLLSPLITLVLGFLSYLLAALVVALATLSTPYDLWPVIMYNQSLYQLPLQYLSLLPFYMVWSLPCVAWFLLVSGWTKSRVFPWAVGMPALVAMVVGFVAHSISMTANQQGIAFIKYVVARITLGNLPGSWILQLSQEQMRTQEAQMIEGVFFTGILNASAKIAVQDYSLLIGLIVGAVLIAITIRRRRYSETIA